MGAVSTTELIMIATTDIYISSRFTSNKGTELATNIQNRDSYYELLKTNADERCSKMSKATALVGACTDNPWIQVSYTVPLSTPIIIFSY